MSDAAAAAVQTQEAPIEVTRKDLPLCCPMPGATLWNMHPRVYLTIEDSPTKEAMCPYCGAHYVLKD